ncbi:MAG TPA: hypothetical protein VGD52_10975 [Pseudoduganella sp.]
MTDLTQIAGTFDDYDGLMDRREFQSLSNMRAVEAQCLLTEGHYAGSYYLMGYSVECALKAVIAGRLKRFSFPHKAFAAACHTHDLAQLIVLAGLKSEAEVAFQENQAFEANWNTVRRWNESSRYVVKVNLRMARTMFAACVQQPRGVLPWIQTFW